MIQVIAAEGEHKASRALRHAADVIADSPAALQVHLDHVENISIKIISVALSSNTEQYILGE